MKKRSISIFFCILLFCISCTRTASIDLPEFGINDELLNSDLSVSAPSDFNSFKTDGNIRLLVALRSKIEVVSSASFNAKIFILDDENKQWVEINNSAHYLTGDIKLDGIDNKVIIVLSPYLEVEEDGAELLILVYGNEVKGGKVTDKLIGAYTFVSLP